MNKVTIDPTKTNTGLDNRKLGMWLFLATEVMLFSSLIAGMLNMKARSPADANDVLNVPLTAVNTFILIVSSLAVVMALSAIEDGDKRRLRNWLLATLALGATFLGIQIFEYTQLINVEGFTPSSSIFGGGFFTVTGFHGFHVFIGLVWCTRLIIQTFRGHFNAAEHMGIEIFGLYWHFVDIVWILLFTLIYLL